MSTAPAKTDELVAKERESVLAMKNAQATMRIVLERNSKLEEALRCARDAILSAKQYIAPGVYQYVSSGTSRPVHARLDEQAAAASSVLGQ